MDIDIIQLIEVVNKYPWQTIIGAIGLAILFAIGMLGYQYLSKRIDKSLDSDLEDVEKIVGDAVSDIAEAIDLKIVGIGENKRELPLLSQSPLFPTIEWLKTLIRTNISTGNKGKDLVLQEIAIKKLEAWDKHLQLLAHEIEDCFCDCASSKDNCNKLFDANMKSFSNAFNEYNNFWYNGGYTEDEKWCLDYVMPIINKHHQPNVDETMEAIRFSCESKYYDNCISRQSTIFFVYSGALNRFTQEVCEAFNEINGHMSGRVFKGVKL